MHDDSEGESMSTPGGYCSDCGNEVADLSRHVCNATGLPAEHDNVEDEDMPEDYQAVAADEMIQDFLNERDPYRDCDDTD